MKHKHTGEGKHPDVALGEGLEIGAVHPPHIKGVTNSLGNSQAAGTATTSDGGSNVETIRHKSKPKSEKVVHAPMPENKATLAKARKYAHRSEHGGAEKEGGW